MGRVVVVGSLNVDRPWRVTRHPAVGETIAGEVRPPLPGGKGLNQAVAARRVGATVDLVGAVGDDADGQWLTQVAQGEGISVQGVAIVADHSTGSALIVVDDDGANTVTVSGGANLAMVPHDLGLVRGDVVVTQYEVPAAVVADALAQCHRSGARSVLNPSPIGADRSLVAAADVVVVNEHELLALAGQNPDHDGGIDRDSAVVLGRSVATADQIVVVTLGADGLVAVGPTGTHIVAGRVVDTVDTTGAGDCLVGVLAARLAAGSDLADALETANRVAALAVTRFGTVPAMPTAAKVGVSDPS